MREDTYELCYNAACCLIGQGKLKDAEAKLRLAQGNDIKNPSEFSVTITESTLYPMKCIKPLHFRQF